MSGKDIRESVGLLLVVASMVFVGLEIRQNTAVARGQTRQELAALNQEWLTLMSQDAEYYDLFARAWQDEDELSEREETRATLMMILNMRNLENVFFQYSEGFVDESALSSYGFQVTDIYGTDTFAAWWMTTRSAFHPEFVRFFSERMGLTEG